MKLPLCMMMVLAVGICSAYAGGEKAPTAASHFSGNTFQEGAAPQGPTVYHGDGLLPLVRSQEGPPPVERLPKGTGAVVLVCYIQSSGGKMASQSGSRPVAGAAVEFSHGSRKIVVRTDEAGYAVAALPSGDYDVSVQGMVRKAKVEKGKTLLLPMRVGKRMVD